ncbi:inner membrane protein YhjD [Pedococcus cremeus]|uniref:Inner membrane protein YhjD n=1 Tax=Pedococcus cremeus TaxID=587636 RepID=A0A1H9XHY2_9MICO|nr:YihY/virulence factor BrkB family protein [Pedococcus cremeus]SES45790.1 inner membrane protein YhjD [Pedococcus cremeus]
MGTVKRLDRLQRRHPAAGLPIAVVYKFADDQGSYLSALLAYYGLVSLFPLLLLLSSLLGFALEGNAGLQHTIMASTLSQFPVIGQQLRTSGLKGSGVGVVIGVLGSLYGGLGIAQAFQNMLNTTWGVPRNERPNPVRVRLRSLALLATAGLAIIATTVLSALAGSAAAYGAELGAGLRVLNSLAAIAVNAAVFVLAFHLGTARRLRWRDSVPGGLLAALAWQVLQFSGTAVVGHTLKNSTAVNGVFGLVLGLVAFLYLAAVATTLSVEVNVVLAKRLWPRALLTPFTDDVDLTRGDRRTYTDAAKAQRAKGFETVDVSFDRQGEAGSPEPDRDDRG